MRLLNRCPHVNLEGIYGDEILRVGGYRLRCDDCGRYLDGPVSLAQALAEETWEYIVQVKRDDQWQFYIGESRLPTDKPGLANGFSQKNHAQEFAKLEVEYPSRVVRRRVSPVEPVND